MLEAVSGASVNGAVPTESNTSSFSFDGIESSAALRCWTDKASVARPAQPAGPVHRKLRTLRAMNPTGDDARRVCVSLGRFNTQAQIDRAIDVVPKVVEKLRQIVLTP